MVAWTGCDQADPAEEETPPDPPQALIFQVQPDFFRNNSKTLTGPNFVAAGLRVAGVSTILGVHLILPTALVGAAAQATPVRDGNAWLWSVDTQANGQSYQYDLTGEVLAGSINWTMQVTGRDPVSGQQLNGFTLFTLTSTNQGRSGTWSLFYPANGNVLDGSYDIESESVWTLVFRIPDTAERAAGDNVTYERDGNAEFFFWDEGSMNRTHDIEWDRVTRAGSITATNYQNGETGCWNSDLDDTPC